MATETLLLLLLLLLYTHTQTIGTIRAGEPRTATSTLKQLLSSQFHADQCRHTNK